MDYIYRSNKGPRQPIFLDNVGHFTELSEIPATSSPEQSSPLPGRRP